MSSATINILNPTELGAYSHELGHALGLTEHYNVFTGVGQNTDSIMDCCLHSVAQAHDAQDVNSRFSSTPWGTGAIWVGADYSSYIELQWADISDNESNYYVYRDNETYPAATVGRDSEYAAVSTNPGQNHYFRVVSNSGTGQSSSLIYRYSPPSAPLAPSSVGVASGTVSYEAVLTYTTSSSSTYTFDVVTVFKGSAKVAQYYLPYHGWGTYYVTVRLEKDDFNATSGSYWIEVAACNQTRNPWYGSCVYGGGVNRTFSY